MENTRLKLSGTTWSDLLGIVIPTVITVPSGEQFRWDESVGSYCSDVTGAGLYIEPSDDEGNITPDSYYELPEPQGDING